MKEVWKPVVGYEESYDVSNLGRVRSKRRLIEKSDGVCQMRNGCIKKQTKDSNGYYAVNLCADGDTKRFMVHRLVATAFVSGWFDGAEVNHKDFNRANNCADNLEWVTHVENIKYSAEFGTRKDISGFKNPNYGNDALKKKYASDKRLSKLKQGRPGAQNGRSIPVIAIFKNGEKRRFDYIGDCAKYLISNGIPRSSDVLSVSVKISSSAKSGSPYFGVRFVIDNTVPSRCGDTTEG